MFRGKKAKRGRKDTRKTGHRWRRNSSRVEKRERERKKKRERKRRACGRLILESFNTGARSVGLRQTTTARTKMGKDRGNREREYFG